MGNQHVRHVCQLERKCMHEIGGLIMDDSIIEAFRQSSFSQRVIRGYRT